MDKRVKAYIVIFGVFFYLREWFIICGAVRIATFLLGLPFDWGIGSILWFAVYAVNVVKKIRQDRLPVEP